MSTTCRGCGGPLDHQFVDLGVSPLANTYVTPARAGEPEAFLSLAPWVCRACLLVQLHHSVPPSQIFSDYAYLSSCSSSWVEHARRFALSCVADLGLGPGSLVVEIASNDGYLLQWFVEAGIEVLGVEPARNVAAIAESRKVPTRVDFFGKNVGQELSAERRADLVIGNNVLAHVPDLHDFVAGLAAIVAPTGRISLEFPHLLRLIEEVQFDTIYHEHFSYFSLYSLEPVFAAHGLVVVDVEELPSHGGSLRLWVAQEGTESSGRVDSIRAAELRAGLQDLSRYEQFAPVVAQHKRAVLRHLIDLLDTGRRVAAYGAPAKGNTLLNYCGIGREMIAYTVDRNPEKQDTLLPGSRIPVLAPQALEDDKPDVIILLPWNLRDELQMALAPLREFGTELHVLRPWPAVIV